MRNLLIGTARSRWPDCTTAANENDAIGNNVMLTDNGAVTTDADNAALPAAAARPLRS